MNEITVIPDQAVTPEGKTTSLMIAEVFGKEHRRVIQTIKELEIPGEFSLHHFVQSTYRNSRNQEQPMYEITRDGFTLLAMGFTGSEAM